MGMQKRLRAAARNNFALKNGKRPFSTSPLGAGQLRAASRLRAERLATHFRLNPPVITINPVAQVVETAVETVKKAVRKLRKVAAVATEEVIKLPAEKTARKPRAKKVAEAV